MAQLACVVVDVEQAALIAFGSLLSLCPRSCDPRCKVLFEPFVDDRSGNYVVSGTCVLLRNVYQNTKIFVV